MLLLDAAAAMKELFEAKHTALAEGRDLHYFHATEDKQVDRNRVFGILAGLDPHQCRVDSVIIQKNKANPAVRDPVRYYCDQVELVLRHQLAPYSFDVTQFAKVMIFLDRVPQRGAAFKAIVKALRIKLPKHLKGVPYELFFHPSMSHHGLQMVDYFSWAIYRKYEDGEMRPYNAVRHLIKTEFDVFRNGTTIYYKK